MASPWIISCLVRLMMLLLLAMVVSSASASLEENANILLEIKALLIDPTGSLVSWKEESFSKLCSDWYGITCDNSSSVIVDINLSSKNLSGALSPALGSLSSLQELNMSNNLLTGSIPVEIAGCASLRSLDLSNNNFTGELPIGFSQLPLLETLSLWTNSFIGPIPQDIVLCSKLKHLDLGGSYLEGEIPHAIGNLTNLVYLTLAGNELSGGIPSSLSHLRKLEWIYIGYNQLTGSIPNELGEITTLKHLDLVQNHLSGEFPHSLTNLTSLEYLFLYDNQLTGIIPPAIANLTKLLSLDLSSNMMSGSIPSGISNLKNLQILNLFSNGFTGEIPSTIADLHSLQVLALWMNNLTGEVPAKLGLQNNLTVVDLSSNQLRGPIPEHLCASKTLHNLILFTNTMSGPIPESLANCSSLKRVRLEDNRFAGSFPQTLANLPLVYYLDLSSNMLSGRIDTFTWNLPSLQVLRLRNNHFNGSIPPSIENSKVVVTLDLSKNSFAGDIPLELGSLTQLTKLYLDGNLLSGLIQSGGLLLCKQLIDLNLGSNQLSGPIPSELSNMEMLSTLDLSHNQFSGTIPPQLGDMDSLVFVDLSFNRLSGELPLTGAFIQINESSVQGNPGLCGGSLGPCISSKSEHAFVSGLVRVRVTFVLFLMGLVLAVVGIGNVIWKVKHGGLGGKSLMKLRSMKSKAWGEWSLKLFQAVKPSVEDVLEAMQEENVVEKKSPCIVYKGSTKGGVQFAAMEMITSYDKKSERGELGAVLDAVGRLRHPNIANVYGICQGTASSIMLFELVEGCRLSSLLQHDYHAGVPFNIERRLHVATDIAKAIMHLHSSCSPPILHGSICSNNVIVDAGFVARLLPPNTSGARLINAINAGAAAEEGGWFADDIRSFGEILLELALGRRMGGNLIGSSQPGDTVLNVAGTDSDHLLHAAKARAAARGGVALFDSRGVPMRNESHAVSLTSARDEQQSMVQQAARGVAGRAEKTEEVAGVQQARNAGRAAKTEVVAAAAAQELGVEVHQAELRQPRALEEGSRSRPAGKGAWGRSVRVPETAAAAAMQPAVESGRVPTTQKGLKQVSEQQQQAECMRDMAGGVITSCSPPAGAAAAAAVKTSSSAMGTEAAQLALELCRVPTQAKLRQVLRVLEGWRRRQRESGPLKHAEQPLQVLVK
eukprot:c24862_g1_i1 orf=153-3653(+)